MRPLPPTRPPIVATTMLVQRVLLKRSFTATVLGTQRTAIERTHRLRSLKDK